MGSRSGSTNDCCLLPDCEGSGYNQPSIGAGAIKSVTAEAVHCMQTEHSYSNLAPAFYEFCAATPVAAPQWLAFNHALASELGLDAALCETTAGLAIFSGNMQAPWSKPLAQAYSGHQFGQLSPRLGDGRALLLAEIIDTKGKKRDIQLKGAGPTPYSRRGDGRSALGPVVREYLVSEAMFALGVPTSRALAAVFTGEPVYRDRPQPGGILTRVAASHIRIGTFQYVAMLQDKTLLQQLADYVIKRHYPQLQHEAEPYLLLLRSVCQAQASLVAHWMSIGFIHGVMNTDNMTVSGETIDYGPCAFLDRYDPHTVFSSIDHQGRYAYKNQPAIAQWNLARLAEALLPLIHQDEQQAVLLATAVLNEFPAMYQQQWQQRFCAKLALTANDKNAALVQQLLELMAAGQLDFTLTFRLLSETLEDPMATSGPAELFSDTSAYQSWHQSWLLQLQQENTPLHRADIQGHMNSINPLFIPRNHQIENIIFDVTTAQDLTLFKQFNTDANSPFQPTPDNARWTEPPAPGGAPYRTFCGT